MTILDRSEINRSLAKAIAYKQCGKQADAEIWATKLIEQLGCAGILAAPAGWRYAETSTGEG